MALPRPTLTPAALRSSIEALSLRGVLALPEPVRRRLAGRPISLDGQSLGVEPRLMLRLMALSGQGDSSELPLEQGRAVLLEQCAAVGGDQRIGAVRDLRVGAQAGRLYTPSAPAPASGLRPLLVFFHGGGFVQGDLDSHDALCRHLAERAEVLVLAVDYRRAPEHRFPAAHDDAAAAYAWACEHTASLGADPTRIGVGGDSAGGNLAAATALEAARRGWTCVAQLLVYPATDAAERVRYRSPALFGQGFFLTAHYIASTDEAYAPDRGDRADPRLRVLGAEVPDGLAPALVVTAGFDPLRDEGEAYARSLAAAGVEVELIRYPDQLHGFFNVVGVGRATRALNAEIATKTGAALRG